MTDDKDLYRELLELQLKMYEVKIDELKKQIVPIVSNISDVQTSIKELALEMVKVMEHVNSKNGDHVHHIAPCSRLTDFKENLEKSDTAIVEMVKEHTSKHFNIWHLLIAAIAVILTSTAIFFGAIKYLTPLLVNLPPTP